MVLSTRLPRFYTPANLLFLHSRATPVRRFILIAILLSSERHTFSSFFSVFFFKGSSLKVLASFSFLTISTSPAHLTIAFFNGSCFIILSFFFLVFFFLLTLPPLQSRLSSRILDSSDLLLVLLARSLLFHPTRRRIIPRRGLHGRARFATTVVYRGAL